MGLYIDIGILAIIAIIAIVNFCVGFKKFGLNNLFTIGFFVALIFLAPVVIKYVVQIKFIEELIAKYSEDEMLSKVVNIAISVVSTIVLAIVLAIVLKIIKTILRKILPSKGNWNVVNKIFGGIFSIALYGVIFLFILGILNALQIPQVQQVLEGGFLYKINFLQKYCNTCVELVMNML